MLTFISMWEDDFFGHLGAILAIYGRSCGGGRGGGQTDVLGTFFRFLAKTLF